MKRGISYFQKIIVFYLIFLLPSSSWAIIVKGTITDEKGKPLPYAGILIKGTNTGALADELGNYQLNMAPGNYTLVARFAAYQPLEKSVKVTASSQTINFQLRPTELSITEVTIRANDEDPAYEIMRQVIRKRAYHESLVKTLETDIYLKGNFRVDSLQRLMGGLFSVEIKNNGGGLEKLGLDSTGSGILYLVEEHSHYYYQAPNKEYNEVQSVRVSGNPEGLGFSKMPPILNIYKNNVSVLGLNERGFISPANTNAFHYYRFKYLGSYEQEGRTISEIQVIPKRELEPLFFGKVYVVEDEWVFSDIELYLTKKAQLTGIDTVLIKQSFKALKKEHWLIQNQVMDIRMRLLGIKVKGHLLTLYQNQRLNKSLPKGIFDQKIIAAYNEDALTKDTSYWEENRPIPMQDFEVNNFRLKDSLYAVEQKEKDSLFRSKQVDISLLSLFLGQPSLSYKSSYWQLNRGLINAFQYNTVEGLSATLDLSWQRRHKDSSSIMTVDWLNRYGFGNHRFHSLLKWQTEYPQKDWIGRYWAWQLKGGSYIYQFNQENPIMPLMNELYTLFGGKNYLKLYKKNFLSLTINRNWGNGLAVRSSLSLEKRNSLENKTDNTFRQVHDPDISPNNPPGGLMMPQQNALIWSWTLQYQPGVKYIQYPKYKRPVESGLPMLTLGYQQGLSFENLTADFIKWDISLEHQLHLKMAGNVNYRVESGGFLRKKEVNFPDFFHLNGNQTFLASPYLNSFQLAPYYLFSHQASLYGQGHLEWHLGGFLTNKIPLFRRLNWYLVTGSNLLYIDAQSNYAEVFVGLENIGVGLFRFGRVDFIAGYNSHASRPDLGLRVSLGGLLNFLFKTQVVKEL